MMGTSRAPMRTDVAHRGKNLERSDATPVTMPLAISVAQMEKKTLRAEKRSRGWRILESAERMALPMAQKARMVRQMSAMAPMMVLEAVLERTMAAARMAMP